MGHNNVQILGVGVMHTFQETDIEGLVYWESMRELCTLAYQSVTILKNHKQSSAKRPSYQDVGNSYHSTLFPFTKMRRSTTYVFVSLWDFLFYHSDCFQLKNLLTVILLIYWNNWIKFSKESQKLLGLWMVGLNLNHIRCNFCGKENSLFICHCKPVFVVVVQWYYVSCVNNVDVCMCF